MTFMPFSRRFASLTSPKSPVSMLTACADPCVMHSSDRQEEGARPRKRAVRAQGGKTCALTGVESPRPKDRPRAHGPLTICFSCSRAHLPLHPLLALPAGRGVNYIFEKATFYQEYVVIEQGSRQGCCAIRYSSVVLICES